VYNPRRTQLMQQAEAAGCQAVNGLGMLVQQGAKAFALWTGQEPDTAVMASAIQQHTL
jgi:shikimate 5-dehydrogenase